MSDTPKQPYLIHSSAVAVPLTGTTSTTTLRTFTLKGNTMGANDMLEMCSIYSYTNSGNNKTPLISVGGTTVFSIALTATNENGRIVYFTNRNSLSSQVFGSTSTNGSYGLVSATGTASIDTSVDQTILWRATLASGAETITLERTAIKVWKFQ